jgi:hypothetical protein
MSQRESVSKSFVGGAMSLVESRLYWLFIVLGLGSFLMAWHLADRDVSQPSDPDDARRTGIMRALGQIDQDPKTRVPFLVEALKDKSPAVRRAAVEALGQIGAPAKDATPALQDAYKAKSQAARSENTFRSEPHPAGWGAAEGFAVAGGLCFLAAALMWRNREPASRGA